jgi:hypothetical protein
MIGTITGFPDSGVGVKTQSLYGLYFGAANQESVAYTSASAARKAIINTWGIYAESDFCYTGKTYSGDDVRATSYGGEFVSNLRGTFSSQDATGGLAYGTKITVNDALTDVGAGATLNSYGLHVTVPATGGKTGTYNSYAGVLGDGSSVATFQAGGHLLLPAGTATAGTAPLKFTSSDGTLLTAPEAGAMEFDGTIWYGTTSTPTRKKFSFSDTDYAGMYSYDETMTITINTLNEYEALYSVAADDIQVGLLSGWTFDEGRLVDGNITSALSNGAGTPLVRITTSAAHNLTTGDIVLLSNSTIAGYDAATAVTVIDADEFDCDDIPYTADENPSAIVVVEPAYLQNTASVAQIFHLHWSISANSAVANKEFKFEPVQNVTHLDNAAAEASFGNITMNNVSGHGLISVNTGDRIWMQVQNTTDAQDIIIKHFNLVLSRQ